MNHYETVFILNPVLSDTQIKETVQKFEDYLVSKGAEMSIQRRLGLKKISLPNSKKEKWFLSLIRVQSCWRRNYSF